MRFRGFRATPGAGTLAGCPISFAGEDSNLRPPGLPRLHTPCMVMPAFRYEDLILWVIDLRFEVGLDFGYCLDGLVG